MAVRAAQPPLPVLPARATPIGTAAGLLEGPDGGVVFVFGSATFAYDPADVVGRRLAAVQLVGTKVATAAEVAVGFGVDTATLWRWRRAHAHDGVLGLAPQRKGPTGPSKLTGAKVGEIRALDTDGLGLAAIAARTGVSTYSVRAALGRTAPASTTRPTTAGQAPRGPDDTRPDPASSQVPDRQPDTPASRQDSATEPAQHVPTEPDPTEPDPTVADLFEDQPAGPVGADELAGGGPGALVVLADPLARQQERGLARAGLLSQAGVVLTEGARLPLVGLLLVLPALATTGLLASAEAVYGRLRNGFYGLRATLLTMVFLALLRRPRAEHLTRIRPADLGRLLGLDRAPEVKTLRRKLAEMAARGQALVTALARRHAAGHPDALGFLYIDGHVRAYSGGRSLPKAHITRMKISAPATVETWVNDAAGDPLFVVTAKASDSLVAELRRLAPQLRELVGARRCTICFDRGGWSPALFAELVQAGLDILTYRKGSWRHEPARAFTSHHYRDPDGAEHEYLLADRNVRIKVSDRGAARKSITLRQVSRPKANGGQCAILTSRTDLTAAEIAYRTANRWRQENYFKYGRTNFALDALDSYTAQPDDPTRSVPNPAKATAARKVAAARRALASAQAGHAKAVAAAEARTAATATTQHVDPVHSRTVRSAQAALDKARKNAKAIPARTALAQVDPDAQILNEDTKQLTHAIRMATYNAESALARLLRPHYPRAEDEARTLLQEAYTTSGDMQLVNGELHLRLDPLSAPRRSRALAALCAELTATETLYPDTQHKIVYTVKGYS